MFSQKQNALCACGSGDKFKHCCGHKSLVKHNNQQTSTQLTGFHQALIKLATDDFDNELNTYIDQSNLHVTESERPTFQTGLLFWFVMHYVLPYHQLAVVDLLLRFQQKDLSTGTTRYVNQWKRIKPSVYEVISKQKQSVTLRELSTDVECTIQPYRIDDFTKGTFIVGALSPFVDSRQFLLTMVTLHGTDEQTVKELMKQYPYKQDTAHFPAFLLALLRQEANDLSFDQEQHEEVAELFVEATEKQHIDDAIITEGLRYWHTYCKAYQPQFKNAKAYAAALEFVVRQGRNETLTQADLAERYDVNASTLSQAIKRLNQED